MDKTMFLLDSQVVNGKVRAMFKLLGSGQFEVATIPFKNYFLRRPKNKTEEAKIPSEKMVFGYYIYLLFL